MPMTQQAKHKTSSASSMSSLMTSLKEAAANKANLRPTPAPVHSINQRQLINMTRYRNILRYQLGRPLGKPLIVDNINSTNLSTNLANKSSNNKDLSDAQDGDVADNSPTNRRKTTAKRKTRSITSSSSPPILDHQDQYQEERHRGQGINIGSRPTDLADDQGGGEINNELNKVDDIHHKSKRLSPTKDGGGKRDIAMENFSKFSAPASGA